MKKTEPEEFAKIAKIMLPKELPCNTDFPDPSAQMFLMHPECCFWT